MIADKWNPSSVWLYIDLVHPHLLFRPRTIGADPKDILHLQVTHEQNVPRNEEPDALTARWTCQAATVSPHLPKIPSLLERKCWCGGSIETDISIVEVGEPLVFARHGSIAFNCRSGAVRARERRLGKEIGVA